VPKLQKLAVANKHRGLQPAAGRDLPPLRDIAAGKPGHLTRVGLGTFVDPRTAAARSTRAPPRTLVALMEIDGEEYLFYKAFPIDVGFIRGTTADPTATSPWSARR
jgi:propionate CoA-transferase